MRLSGIRPQFVEFIPRELEEGILYISERYRTASHKCACGCGEKVVTPLSPADWHLQKEGDLVSLRPSIGNWSYRCRSHYWIRRNRIQWAAPLTSREIALVQQRDKADKAKYIKEANRQKELEALTPGATVEGKREEPRSTFWDRINAWLRRSFGA